MPPFSRRSLALVCAAALALTVSPLVASAETEGALPARALAQIAALAKLKAERTADQSKVESSLLTAAQLAAGEKLPAAVRVHPTVDLDSAGRAPVNVTGTIDARLLQQVRSVGGIVRSSTPESGGMLVDLPLDAVETVAAVPQVRRLTSLASTPVTSRVTPPGAPLTKQERAAQLQQQIEQAVAARSSRRVPKARAGGVTVQSGSVTSQGDRAHGADRERVQRALSGVGVTVGVLSDGVDALATSIVTGDLPADTRVLPDQAGAGNEGTAMLQIIHDVAPKADLIFATGFEGPESFAANIRRLREAGADIIVDDLLYYGESPFQDGPIAQAVIDVTRAGALYFSSAGNEGNLDDGTSGNYEGDFRPSGQRVGRYVGEAHDFNPGAGVQVMNPTNLESAGVPALLQWADPLGRSANDYDLYALDPAGNVVGFSNDRQNGNDDPFESFRIPYEGAPVRLVVVKFAGANRYFQLTAYRGRFRADGALKAYSTPGVTRGHSAVESAFSVAAVPADDPMPYDLHPGDPANPGGPYPYRFTSRQRSEHFTSDGPRRVFFRPDGEPITPGNLTSTGGQLRAKPDLAAADGVATTAPGYNPFFGTSAAAPHAAALAALALSGRPGLTPARMRDALLRTALDIEGVGRDRDTGYGIVNTAAMLAAVDAQGQPYAVAGAPVVTSSTDGDTFLEPGESATIAVAVTNEGDVAAANVRMQLESRASLRGVTIDPPNRSYGTIAANGSVTRTFRVRVPRTMAPGTPLAFRTRVSFVGVRSPRMASATLIVGEPSTTPVVGAYTGPPRAIPDAAAGTGIAVPLTVRGVGRITKVTFSIDGRTCSTAAGSPTVGLDHTFVGDLVGTLSAPDGTTVELFDRVGGGGNNFCQTVFSDTATRPIQEAQVDGAPFTGTWQPTEPLAALVGRSGNGRWTFRVKDTLPLDRGTVRSVSVQVYGFRLPTR